MSEAARKQGRAAPAPLDWGASREMNAIEALMWRGEADPRLRSTICSFGVLDCAPDWQRFLAACEWGTRMVPRFRQKVVEPAFGLGNPVWVNDPDFDLHYHVRRQRITEGGGWREALECAEQIAMTPFDRARSPLEVVLFEGLPEGRAAMLLKMHHSATDGIGGFQLFSKLHSRKREHNPSKPQPAPAPPEWKTPRDVLREQLERDARQIVDNLREGASGVVSVLRHPVESATAAASFAASLRRVLAEPEAEGSPLLRHRSLSWRFQAFDVSFPHLRAAAKSAGASLNDAFLSALLGAFRLYHEKFGVAIETMPIAIPISVRRADDPEGGNRFTGARFAAPVGAIDPALRMRKMGDLVRDARREPALDGMSVLAPLLTRLPAPLISQLGGSLTSSNDLQASNVPGFQEELFMAGAKIERVYGLGPLPGCATMITLITHGSTACVGVNLDPAAVTDPELFAECVMGGFAEVLGLQEGSPAPLRRV
ncbi:MAG TPA: wax ester/triacylglycerol synthase domain-containing protein [Myxococcota bacterium]|nr:wax ester/triacylglycerol synthase domain-containing protein [Myxococcota bacterium]